MRTITQSIILTMSLMLITGSAAVMANENNSRSDQQPQLERTNTAETTARATGSQAELQARARAQQAESNRASTPNERETQAREQASLRQQEARTSAQQGETQARDKSTTMNAATARPEMSSKRPAMPQRPARVSRSSFH